MALSKLQFKPGINREITSYSDEGGWYDMDKVRFRSGFPEKIGGWVKWARKPYLGTCRAILPWVSLNGTEYVGFGTNLKYYVNEGGVYVDITPIRSTTSAGAITFAAAHDTLDGAITAAQTTIALVSSAGFPVTGKIKIGSEAISYESISGNTLVGCTRGIAGTTAASHNTGAAVNTCTLIVSDTNHGAVVNDFVRFSGAASLGGNITASILNQEYQVVYVVDASTYYIEARTVSSILSITTASGLEPTYVFSNVSDSGTGGASVVGEYQINVGLDTSVNGSGWGAGGWGVSGWGEASDVSVASETLRIWSHDNYGEDLLMNVRDGGIYYWDTSGGVANRAVSLDSLAGANTTPTIAKQIMLSDRDRHVIAFGCDDEFTPGVQDPLLIRFSSQESLTEWQTLPTNTAGSLRLSSGSEIVCAVETKQQTLVFTDASVYSMQFLGPPFTFGINLIAAGTTIIGPMSAIAVDDTVYWMGVNRFYVYSGVSRELPCSVLDYVFTDFNFEQEEKVTAGHNSAFSEIWWFYPSADSEENDRYVVYNYKQDVWYYGSMARTAWVDRGILMNPLAASPDHYSYSHESGFDDGSTSPASPISTYIESAMSAVNSGDEFVFISRIIPDITFRNSESASPQVDFVVKVNNFPGGDYMQSNTRDVAKITSVPVEQYTNQVFVRLRGRQFVFRVESSTLGVAWRLGSPRIDFRMDGRR